MKTRLIWALALAVPALAPSMASAEGRFVDATGRLTDDVFDVRLESTETLGEPTVRTSPGFVRVWFPGMRAARLDVDGDGRAVREIRVRPGVSDTSVTIIRVGDMRRLPADAVAVHVDETIAHVRIDREALPRPTIVERAAPADDLADLTADLSAEAEAAPLAPSEASANDAEVAEVEAAEEPEAEPTPAPAEAATPLALTADTEAMPISASDGLSTTVVMVLLTLLLGVAYGIVRIFQKKKPAGPRADIEIVATKRLGARHQLLVVRALGEDHLLAVQQGKTERLASMPAPPPNDDATGLEDEDLALPFLRLGAGEEDPSTRTLHRKKAKVEERPRFGADLMRLVAERSRRGPRLDARPDPSAERGGRRPAPVAREAGALTCDGRSGSQGGRRLSLC